MLTAAELGQLLAFITRMSSRDLADLKGVSPGRAHQLVAGALVARAAMRALHVPQVEICPWALREGVIFRRLDTLDGGESRRDDLSDVGCATGRGAVHRRSAEGAAATAVCGPHLPW